MNHSPFPRFLNSFAILATSATLAGCAYAPAQPPSPAAASPAAWQAQLPPAAPAPVAHQGSEAQLLQWWRGQGDPLLAELIAAAQAVSPTLSDARAQIANARAGRTAAGAALLPTLDGSLQASRNSAQPPLPMATTTQGTLQAAWEIDLFGGGRAARDAAQARYEGAQAGWHDARVSIAAEVANQYYNLRTCERLVELTAADAESRAATGRLTALAAEAGFQAPATAALARATTAEANSRLVQQRAACDLDIKALVAMSAMPEPELRRRLQENAGSLPQDAQMTIESLPAALLAQRPDLAARAREVAAASADIGAAEAQRYPRLTLAGSVGAARFRSSELSGSLDTWSVGPIALTLPLFDGGRRAANADAARERYEAAASQYRAAARQAVREVEEALVRLDSTARRSADAVVAVEGYTASFSGIEARYRGGLASLLELEEVRRVRLTAEIALLSLQYERTASWIALYRAAGGGWDGGLEQNASLDNRPGASERP
jgi:NodT family efflux transporter outer membrane factor (OMF) lipoprotein